ncbi:flavoprotein [Micromonospora sp. NPDC049559]|uniref:flavoprotein n=1 Tax=Micromonospora sp. NPDC049559 TaxID=3155923 RepID=UPI00343F095E
MTELPGKPVLYVVACGGRAAGRLGPFVAHCQDTGWEVCVVATPSALKFMDVAPLVELTGHPVRSDYKRPDEPDVLPPADAMVVAPATFNTINKMAYGNSDTLALGLLNEAIGLGLPIVAVPTANAALARHPAFVEAVSRLRSWGVTVLLDPPRHPLPSPDDGPASAEPFPWDALTSAVAEMLSRRPGGVS